MNEAVRNALHQLNKAVVNAVLAYPDPNKEYLLETDASKLSLGAVLSQKQSDGRYHPLWLSGVGCYMEQRSITTVLNLSFWP